MSIFVLRRISFDIIAWQQVYLAYNSGADPGFPVGGGGNIPGEDANIQIFPKTA